MLKSVNRLRRNIFDRDIKKVYVLDSYFGGLVQNILTDVDVEIVTIKINSSRFDVIDFTREDAVVVTDMTIHNLNTYTAELIIRAKFNAGLVSILTEDAWCFLPDYLQKECKNINPNDSEDIWSKIVQHKASQFTEEFDAEMLKVAKEYLFKPYAKALIKAIEDWIQDV